MQSQQQSFMEKAENKNMRKFLSTLTKELESQLDPGFIQDDNDVKKNNNNEMQQHKIKNWKFITECFLQKIQARRCRKNKLCY